MSTGIESIGVYLPDNIRTNASWPPEIVARWRDAQIWDGARSEKARSALPSEGVGRMLAAMAKIADDPFQGTRERRVRPDGMPAAEMEARAAEEAIARAGVAPADIDFVLGFTFCPDHLGVPNACMVHDRLGLRRDCLAMSADAACNSFQAQLMLADGLIASGRARHGLLTQSSAIWRITPPEEAYSVHFGDGATAVVVGPASDGHGLLSQVHRTDGTLCRALVSTVPGKEWYEEGRIVTQSLDRRAARELFLGLADRAKEVVLEALRLAGASPDEVDFFASHQPSVYFRELAQDYIGLHRARVVDTFPWTGTLSAANVPLVLALGERAGLLRDGDLVAMFSGGAGITYSGAVLRWGR